MTRLSRVDRGRVSLIIGRPIGASCKPLSDDAVAFAHCCAVYANARGQKADSGF
jgi:hypothetical protein